MAKKLSATAPGRVEFVDYEVGAPKNSEVLIKTQFSTCKHGTESWVIKGTAHWLTQKRDRERRYFYGTHPDSMFPAPLGNLGVGEIVELGPEVQSLKKGDRVLYYSGAQDYVIQNEDQLWKLPQNMTWQEAVCLDPLEFAIGAVRDGGIKCGDNVGVFGMGAIGLITIQMAKLQGARNVVAIDPIAERRKLALEMGADFALDPMAVDIGHEVREQVWPTGLDVTIDFSGNSKAHYDAIRSLGYLGTFVIGAMSPESNSDLKLGLEFHWNRIKIISSRACSEPDPEHPRWSRQRILETAWELLTQKKLKVEPIVLPIVPFRESVDHYEAMLERPSDYLKLSFAHD